MAGMYATLGGRPAFDAAVEDFYRRVVRDPQLRPYFAAIDLERLKAHQQSFLAMALGGPRTYLGRTMASAHSTLAITDEAFDRVLDHLVSTLAGLGVPGELIREIVTGLLSLRHDIVRVQGTERDRPGAWRPPGAPAGPASRPDQAPAGATVPPGPVPDGDEWIRPAGRPRPAPAAPGWLFEPDPENPAARSTGALPRGSPDPSAHDQPVSRRRPIWR
jgi:hemoglobin